MLSPKAGPLLGVFGGGSPFVGDRLGGIRGPGGGGGAATLRRLSPRGWLQRGFPREAERGGAAGGGRASAGVTGEEEKWAEKSEWTRGGRESGSGRRRWRRAGAAFSASGDAARSPSQIHALGGWAGDPTPSPNSNPAPSPGHSRLVPVPATPIFQVPSRVPDGPLPRSLFLPGLHFTFSAFRALPTAFSCPLRLRSS